MKRKERSMRKASKTTARKGARKELNGRSERNPACSLSPP